MDNFEKLKVLTGEKDGVLLQILLDDASSSSFLIPSGTG